jgi:beta propeller repeat protein
LILTHKPFLKLFKLISRVIFLVLLVVLGYYAAFAATETLQEFWTVFLIEEDDVNGVVAIYGNKVARRSFFTPNGHLVIIDLLDGSTRHYGIDEYVWGIDWIDMDGDWVVTSNHAPPQNPNTIHAINLVTDEHVAVAPYPGFFVDTQYPAIEGNNIVWMHYRSCCGWDLLHFDLDSRTTISITNDGWQNTEYWPDVSGDWVVWNNGASQSGDIHAYNMATTEHVTVTQDSFAQWYPKIDGNLLTWTDGRNGDLDIYGFDMQTRQEFPLVEGINYQYGQAIDGNLLTWLENLDGGLTFGVYSRNLDTGETSPIYESPFLTAPYGPTFLSGNVVIWVFSEDYSDPRLYGARRLTYQSYLPVAAKADSMTAATYTLLVAAALPDRAKFAHSLHRYNECSPS